MKNKFIVCSPNVSSVLMPAISSLIIAIILAVLGLGPLKNTVNNPIISLAPSLISLAVSLFFFYRTFRYHVHKLTVTGSEIVLSSIFCTVQRVRWTTVEKIYLCDFQSFFGVKTGHVHFGGIDITVPRNIPEKWIMVADVREDFCENIYEFLIPNGDMRAIKLVYDQRILDAIAHYTEKEIVYKMLGYKTN